MSLRVLNREAELRVARLLGNKRPSTNADIVPVAVAVVASLPVQASTKDTLRQYASTCRDIDDIKVRTRGFTSSTYVSNRLMNGVADAVSSRLPIDRVVDVDMLAVMAELGADWNHPWWSPKFRFLRDVQTSRVGLGILAGHLFPPAVLGALDRLSDVFSFDALQSQVSAVAGELDALRRYGLKPSLTRDGLLHPSDKAWALWDDRDLGGAEAGDDAGLAFSALVAPDVKSLDTYTTVDANTRVVRADYHTYAGHVMLRDGSLDAGNRFGLAPVEGVFRQVGMEHVYPIFQLVQVMRVYDLVVPLERVRELSPWPQLEARGPFKLHRRSSPAEGLSRLPELVLPRIRLLENSDPLVAALQRELDGAYRDMLTRREGRPDREISRHTVTGHVRTLPPGRRPSPEARAAAWEEQRITLADNETWVRKHSRGSGPEQPVGHQVRQRAATSLRPVTPKSQGRGSTKSR